MGETIVFDFIRRQVRVRSSDGAEREATGPVEVRTTFRPPVRTA